MVKKAIVSIVLVLSVVLFSNCSYAEEEGLVGYWKFDESKGEIAKDFSGNGNDGIICGATATAGKIGQALSFDGKGSYVDCGSTAGNFGTGPFTVEMWIKTGAVVKGFFYNKREANQEQILFSLSAGKPYFIYNAGPIDIADYAFIISNTALQPNTWYHLAAVVDRQSPYYATIYVDGVDDGASSTGVNGSPGTANMDNTGNLWIGKSLYVGTTDYFNGLIDEVRIYNRALTAAEVENHYKMGSKDFI